MANEIISQVRAPFCLPLEEVNHADTLCRRIDAACDILGEATARDESLNPGSVLTLCETVRDWIGELNRIVDRRTDGTTEGGNA